MRRVQENVNGEGFTDEDPGRDTHESSEESTEAESRTPYKSHCKEEFNTSYWQAGQIASEASKAEEEERQDKEQEETREEQRKKEKNKKRGVG